MAITTMGWKAKRLPSIAIRSAAWRSIPPRPPTMLIIMQALLLLLGRLQDEVRSDPVHYSELATYAGQGDRDPPGGMSAVPTPTRPSVKLFDDTNSVLLRENGGNLR